MFSLSDARQIASSEANSKLLDYFLKRYRRMEDDEARARLKATMIERDCFYVPFDAYIKQVHGKVIRESFRDYYTTNGCLLTNSLCMPLLSVKEEVLGLLMNNPTIQEKYMYPVVGIFQKSRYLQMTKENYIEALRRNFVFIVEGVYDEMSVSSCGVPVVGLSGSSMTRATAQILDVIPNKIVCSDEDDAGRRIFQECQKVFSGKVISVKLPTNDIDEFLRSEENAKLFVDKVTANEVSGWATRIVTLGES